MMIAFHLFVYLVTLLHICHLYQQPSQLIARPLRVARYFCLKKLDKETSQGEHKQTERATISGGWFCWKDEHANLCNQNAINGL